jgi:pimeloyl-ACP methyl ester carboxylesterase
VCGGALERLGERVVVEHVRGERGGGDALGGELTGEVVELGAVAEGAAGAIAISPGLNGTWPGIAWLGPRLSSQGFVVFGIDTLALNDNPASRGSQLLAALDYLTQTSSVRTRVDASRLAVAGHSLGGGGAFEAALRRPTLKAAIPNAPFFPGSASNVRVPTLISTTPPTSSPSAQPTTPGPTSPPPTGGACAATYRTVNAWSGAYQGEMTVRAGSSAINGWTVRWTMGGGQTISQVWNGTLVNGSGAAAVRNAAYNGSLGAGASTTFGFISSGTPSATSITCGSP